MSKKRNRIDVKTAQAVFMGFGLRYRHLNHFTVRLTQEETHTMWDWFHTTGSLVTHKHGYPHKNAKKFLDPEVLAEHIISEIYS